MKSLFFEKVYDAVLQVPFGKVVTYGDIANFLRCPKMSRQVGFALHANPHFGVVPCHRVVNRFGGVALGFAFGGGSTQKEMLQAEGVVFEGDALDLQKYRHRLED
ncbi:MAG: MGMT family protein [Firmicutes bacterium]|nr:MGMT family protein [Bacillota bacterium]